jgi:hypothetical protein
MSRFLEVESCAKCPHYDHKGAFAVVACVPICRKVARELPYEAKYDTMRGRALAHMTVAFPDWCPLPTAIGEVQ